MAPFQRTVRSPGEPSAIVVAGPARLVGPGRLELPTLRLSGVRSNQAELRAYGGTTARQETQARDRTLITAGRTPDADEGERGKRNGDGGAPQFIGVPIDNLVRDGLEEHP